jgi:hypothetical protein
VHSRPGQSSMAKPPLDESLGHAEEGAHLFHLGSSESRGIEPGVRHWFGPMSTRRE